MMESTGQSTWIDERSRNGHGTEGANTWAEMSKSADPGADKAAMNAVGESKAEMEDIAGAALNAGSVPGADRGEAAKTGLSTGSFSGGTADPGPGEAAWGTMPRTAAQGTVPDPAPQGNAADTEETRRLRENFGFIAPAAFAYAVFYVLCMYRNNSGITFPFFVGGSLMFLHFSFLKLGITFKKGSAFYGVAMILLGISTFCTDDGRIIFWNKLGVFLLTMSLLLKQFFDTSKWRLGKYLGSICRLVFASIGELGRPFTDGAVYGKSRSNKLDKRIWYVGLGLVIGIPLLLIVLLLLSSADAIFGQMAERFLEAVNLADCFGILLRMAFVFFASYALIAYLCKRKIREEVPDGRKGEPVLAITITALLTALYLLFSCIQIGGLFLGRLQLPEGYTYAMYAREGFFQLLAVGLLNLAIVLACMSYFRESRVLKGILTVMSACTFIMIASSAMRMVIYIRYYYLTFLRILVLWGLALLAVLFIGIVVNIFRESFPLFRYCMAAVAVFYLALSFAHPDYIIAKVNIANTAERGTRAADARTGDSRSDLMEGGFFLAKEPYQDYAYLRGLSADAAPVLVPYLEELGYHMEAFGEDFPLEYARDMADGGMDWAGPAGRESFGYYWMSRQKERTKGMGIRTFNLSRYLALRSLRR